MDQSYSLREASKIAQVSVSTMRRWVTSGEVPAKKRNSKTWTIESTELQKFLSLKPRTTNEASKNNNENQSKAFEILLEESKEALRRERRISDELRVELRESNSEIRKLENEIRALLEQKSDSKMKGFISRWIRI